MANLSHNCQGIRFIRLFNTIQLTRMKSSVSDIIDNEFISNPERAEATYLKNSKFSKDSLNKKRLLIEKELRSLMSKVDEYQNEKKLMTKSDLEQEKSNGHASTKEKQFLQQFQLKDVVKRKPDGKQTPKTLRHPVRSSKQRTSRYNQRSNSQKSTEFPQIDNKSKLKSNHQKEKYKNYLPEIDFKVPLPHKSPNLDKKKEQLINYLQRAQEYEKDAIRKIAQIKKGRDSLNYMEYIEVENQVDDVFVNSLRSRLQCALKM